MSKNLRFIDIFRQHVDGVDTFPDANRQTASNYLRHLADAGVLEEIRLGREKLFLHSKFMGLLLDDTTEYAPYPQ